MRLMQAIDTANLEIPEILTEAGLINGLTNKTAKNAKFYRDRAPEAKDTEANTYVVWSIISMAPITRADDSVRDRDAYIMINVYTREASTSKYIHDLISRIETSCIKKGWSFDFSASDFDKNTQVTYLSFDVSKIL